jgi:hypothetical protein
LIVETKKDPGLPANILSGRQATWTDNGRAQSNGVLSHMQLDCRLERFLEPVARLHVQRCFDFILDARTPIMVQMTAMPAPILL